MMATTTSPQRRETWRQFLIDAVALLSSSLDYQATLTTLANLVVPEIADWCSIAMREDDGSIRTLAVAHVDPAKVALAHDLQKRYATDPDESHGLALVIRSGEPQVTHEITDAMLVEAIPDPELLATIRYLGFCSSMIVPLKARGQTLGAITLVSAESAHLFDDDDLALAQDLASRAALAIDNARLYQQARRVAAEHAAVMERIADALVLVDSSEEITFMNEAARRFFGAQLGGKSVEESARQIRVLSWEDAAIEPDRFPSRRALRGETVRDLEWKVILPDIGTVYLQGSASPVDAQDGTRIGAVIAFRDVTERRRADEAQGQLAAIVESSGDAILGKTLDGIITSWNHGAERLYGYAPDEILRKPVALLAPPDRRDEIPEILRRVARGERVENLETARRRKDGQTIEVSLTVSPIIDASGKITGASSIARDITEAKRAQRAVERQAALLDLSHDAVLVRDFETDAIQFWNRGAESMYGFSSEEAIGVISHDLLQTVHPMPVNEAKQQLVRTGHCEMELVHTKRDGARVVVMSRWSLQQEEGQPTSILETNTDITEQKRADEELHRLSAQLEERVIERTIQLESANKELEAFAYSVSHDLRAPLRSMDGFSQVLLERFGETLDERGTRYLNHIRDAAQEMGRLIDALLQLSRVSRGEMRREQVDLTDLVWSIVADLRETDPGRDVGFVIDDGVVTVGDAQLLRVTLENLIGNAWKYTRKTPHACIEFRVMRQNTPSVYMVRDNGAGFDMTYVNKLFTPFQRLHATGDFEGTGIGLATVQRIVHRHGGRIWAESAVGQGATFYLTLQPDREVMA